MIFPLTFSDVHWGEAPRGEIDVEVWDGPARIVGECRSISYASAKGGKPEIYKHTFERHHCDVEQRQRRVYLLQGCARRDADFEVEAGDLEQWIAVGLGVEIRLMSGDFVLLGGCWIATTPEGDRVALVFADRAPYCLESWPGKVIVTADGIEG